MHRTLISRFILFIIGFTFATSYLSDTLIKYQIDGLTSEYLDYESRLISESLELSLVPLIRSGDETGIQDVFDTIGKNPIIEQLSLLDPGQNLRASFPGESENSALRKPSNIIHSTPLRINNNTVYQLEISLSAAYQSAVASLIRKQIMYIYLAMQVVMIIGIIMIFYRLISDPLTRLNSAAEAVKHSNYKIRIENESSDEIGQLATTFNDMTASIEHHMEALKNAREKAESAAEAKMKFLANMSHEIRTPLNSILGFSDLLHEMEEDIVKRSHLDIIRNSGDHLLAIINDILDFSKLETESLQLEIVPFTMRGSMYDIAKMFEMDFRHKKLKFSLDVSERVPRILTGDILRIKQVIINLLSNAVKFTDRGKIYLHIDYQEGEVLIRIRDTGIGISKDQQTHIFESFTQADYSTTRLYGGTGLGLAISKKLIHCMGGTIHLESKVGEGTQVELSLPLEPIDRGIYEMFGGEIMVKNWLGTDLLIYDLVLNAITELPTHLQRIKGAFEVKDMKEVFQTSHALKGLTGNFHMKELFGPAAELCESVRAYDKDLNYQEIEQNLKRLEEAILAIPKYYFDNIVIIPEHVIDEKPLTNARILVAEDVYENWLLMKFFLKDVTLYIDHAENGIEALNMIEQNHYDLLLLDMQMPYISGKEIIQEIHDKENYTDLHIIIVTANASKSDTDEYLKLGCDFVLPKPVNKNVLKQKVMKVIQGPHDNHHNT